MVDEIGSDQASYVTADVSNVNDVKNYINKTLSIFKKIDITLLNAGVEGKIANIQTRLMATLIKFCRDVRGVWLGLKYTMPVWLKMAVVQLLLLHLLPV